MSYVLTPVKTSYKLTNSFAADAKDKLSDSCQQTSRNCFPYNANHVDANGLITVQANASSGGGRSQWPVVCKEGRRRRVDLLPV